MTDACPTPIGGGPVRTGLAALALGAAFASGGVQARPPSSPEPTTMNSRAPEASSTGASTVVRGANGVRLEVEFGYRAAPRVLQVSYRLHNPPGAPPLAVFDRGDLHEVRIGRQKLGAIGQPGLYEQGGDVELTHTARPLPDPAPTSPPTPLAAKVAAGAILDGRFESQLWSQAEPRRLRWCVGVMPFEASFFDAPVKGVDGEVYSAPFAAAQAQQMLCTPWFDAAKGAFEA